MSRLSKPVAEPEKLDLRSHNLRDDNRQELLHVFPATRTEGGKVDFERLCLALHEIVDQAKDVKTFRTI
jgi:adenine-specific DNA-methyltransferase